MLHYCMKWDISCEKYQDTDVEETGVRLDARALLTAGLAIRLSALTRRPKTGAWTIGGLPADGVDRLAIPDR
jgi:hypothetical protein